MKQKGNDGLTRGPDKCGGRIRSLTSLGCEGVTITHKESGFMRRRKVRAGVSVAKGEVFHRLDVGGDNKALSL
jgi:hypothetical protein